MDPIASIPVSATNVTLLQRPQKGGAVSPIARGEDIAQCPGPDVTPVRGITSVASAQPRPCDTPTHVLGVSPQRLAEPQIATTFDPQSIFQQIRKHYGDMFAGFRLVRELGRGAFGCVFLAEQIDLADRRVALKISAQLTGEVRTLARLQHTNIVPVYSWHRAPPLMAVCMPYFGGTTLASVLSAICSAPEAPTSGRIVIDAVRKNSKEVPAETISSAVSYLEGCSYVDAVLWMGERLADALAHAHERGIIHRDIKPANILMAHDGQPMLLDFNLADDSNESAAERARVGGTLPYMAPEQMRGFIGGTNDIDARVDVYALGSVLFQLLARRLPYPEHFGQTKTIVAQMHIERRGPIPFIRQHNADVSPAFESIVRKCLEPDPANRYPSAAALRDDLARQRAYLPLNHAAEPSRRERVRKWVARNPRFVSTPALLAYAAAVLLLVSAITVQQSLAARTHRQDAERTAALRHYEEFRTLANQVKEIAGSASSSRDVLQLGTAALDRYGATEAGWENSEQITRLPDTERAQLKIEIGEIAFLTARAAGLVHRDGEQAVRLNALADTNLGDDARPAIAQQRSELTGLMPGEIAAALNEGDRSIFLRSCDLTARGRYRDALPLVNRFVAHNPTDYAGWFLKGRCHDVLGQYEDARAAYSTAGALNPGSAAPLAARGELAHHHGRDLVAALADLDRALRINSGLFDARLKRALVFRQLRKFDEAEAALSGLIHDQPAMTRLYFVRATVRDSLGNKDGAAADRAIGMTLEPTDAISFVTRGLAREAKEPEKALADYKMAEQLDPLLPEALVNQASVLGERLDRATDAIAVTDRLLELYPDHPNGRGGRAVLLARIGRCEEAVAEARRLLAANASPAVQYHAACVFALAAKTDPQYRDVAVRLVALALQRGEGHQYVLGDPDLDPIRADERFRKLTDAVKVMQSFGSKK